MDPTLRDLIDKQAIADIHARYCRALDRMDKAAAYDLFRDDCRVNYYGIYEGTGRGFVDWVWQAHAHMERHSHQITNMLIDNSGDSAVSEAYVTVVLWSLADEEGVQKEIVCRGRYLDRLEREGGQWRITQREHVVDMHSVYALERAAVSDCSTRDRSDASWRFFSDSIGKAQ